MEKSRELDHYLLDERRHRGRRLRDARVWWTDKKRERTYSGKGIT